MVALATQAQQHSGSIPIMQVDSLLKTIYRDNEPGASIAILQNNRLFKHSYGLRDLKTTEKITSKTNFNIGSLTKQFTAMAILQLAARKKLSLQDHLDKFFPELTKKIAETVNVQQLLTHSSGIIDHYDYVDTKQIRHAHDADVLNGIKNIDSSYFTPGSNYRYSNTAFCLLALIIERLSGMPYATYLKKNIFEPLGMTNTSVWSENEAIRYVATGYEYEKLTGSFQRSCADENIFFSTEGDGGIYTSIDDYLKWMRALQSGKIFSATSVKLARSPQFPINKEKHLSYGYGWFVDKSSVPSKIYHSGTNGGFRTYSFTIPDERYMIVVFSNRTGIDLEQLVSEINKILRPAR